MAALGSIQAGVAARAVRKAAIRLVPLMALLGLVNYLDRVNVGYAALTMNADLGLSSAAYGLGAGLFFVGYILFEVPSNLVMHRVGARVWMARIMVTWGLIASAMAFIDSRPAFYLLRFLLGVAEAGFFPGMILYLGYWFPRAKRARLQALFLLGVPLASVFGAPLSSLVLEHGAGWFGFAESWRTMLFIEGLPAVALGVLVFFVLPSRPAEARWLTTGERDALAEMIASEDRQHVRRPWSLRRALTSRRVLALALADFGIVYGLYAIFFFLPQIIQSLQTRFDVKFSLLQIGLVTAIPFAAAAVAMVLNAAHSDRTGERRAHVAIPTLIGAVAIALALYLRSPIAVVAAISIGAAGIFSALPVFWQLPSAFLSGSAAAGAIAMINSLANLSGFAGPYVTGWLDDATGGFEAGLLVAASFMVLSAVITLRLGRGSDALPETAPSPDDSLRSKPSLAIGASVTVATEPATAAPHGRALAEAN